MQRLGPTRTDAMRKLAALLVVALYVALGSGCKQSYHVEGPPSYSHNGIVVIPQVLEMKGSKLKLRFTFANHLDDEITIDKNQMVLRLPEGSEQGRHAGTFGKFGSGRHVVQPGESHNVFLDFLIEGEPPTEATLEISGVIVDGKPLDLPDYEIAISSEE